MFSCIGMIYSSSTDIAKLGIFYGYSPPVLTLIVLQSLGGLIVAACIKYADNILKGFATSISIIVSSVFSWYVLHDLPPGPYFMAGTSVVLGASLLYGLPISKLFGWDKKECIEVV